MSERAPTIFTVERIATELRKSAATVRQALSNVEPDGKSEFSGNTCKAWAVGSLPQSFREELARRAFKKKLTIEEMLNQSANKWSPKVPLKDCLPADIEKAKRLRRAWAATIERMRSPALLPGELARQGLRDFTREFGFEPTLKHWNFLHERLLSRDGGDEQFARLELYLDDNVRRARPEPICAPQPAWLEETEKAIASFEDPARIKATEEIVLWLRALDSLKAQTQNGISAATAKRELTKYLFARLPAIAKTEEALRKQVDRKWSAWAENESGVDVITDRRRTNSGFWRAPDLSEPEFIEIVGYAAHNCGGRISQAWREMRRLGKLPQRFLQYYKKPANKSWVPKRVRAAISVAVEQEEIYSHGPRFAILAGPSIPGDYASYHAMDWYQADDATLNHMVWFIDPATNEVVVTRGQLLLMICARTMRILNFLFLYSKTYNSFSIASLMKHTLIGHGAAHEGWAFENGLWRTSKLVKGNQNAREFSYDEAVDLGFRKFGMKFRHSLLPRAKPVERVFGILQDKMQGMPGYVGRNSRSDRFEEAERMILDVRAGRRDPADCFLHADEWVKTVEELCLEFNAEPLQGKMHRGLSPDDACKAFSRGVPRMEFHPSMGCVFNPYVPTTISRNGGVTLTYGKHSFTYLSEELGRRIGEPVLVSFDVEDMSQAAIMDLKKENIHVAQRLEPIPRSTATSEQIRNARGQIKSFLSTVNGRHVVIKAIKEQEQRDLRMDAKTKNHIVDYTTKMQAANEATEQKRRRVTAIEANAKRAGVTLTESVKARSGASEALERIAKAKQDWLEARKEKADEK